MKKLVDERSMYRINGGDWIDFSPFHKIRYYDEEQTKEWLSRKITFSEMVELIKDGLMPNSNTGQTFFRKKKYIILPTDDIYGNCRYYEKKVKTIELKKVYLPFNNTITVLMDLLPANQFCEFIADNNCHIKVDK